MKVKTALTALFAACIASHSAVAQDDADRSGMTIGNGEKSWIIVDGLTRDNAKLTYSEVRTIDKLQSIRRGDGATFIVPEVRIDGDGWLVMHPFIDGKPNGDYVAGYTFVKSGKNENVKITVNPVPKKGDMYIIMLHSDVDGDKVFDFVFTDGVNVEDKAVFEGTKMIAHAIAVP